MNTRARVLLIVEACNPEWVSVPLVGWSHSQAIAAVADAHLVTQIRNREALLRAGLVEGRDFTAIDSEPLARPLCRLGRLLRGGSGKGWTTLSALGAIDYYYFEYLVWKQFGQQIRDHQFDLVHRLVPLSPTIPSILAARCDRARVPFVLGPLNGGVPWPRQFGHARRKEREWLSYVRSAYKLLPGYRSTLSHSRAIFVGSLDTLKQIPARYHPKCVYLPENAIDPARFTIRRSRCAERPIRVVFVGRLVPYKGADMLIEAAAPLLRDGTVQLEIIGDGPQMGELRELVQRAGVTDRVQLAGWIEHAKLQTRLAQADVLAFPSIREFGGGVVLEAMAVGLVPVVVNYAGPGELVTAETGIRVQLGSRTQIVERFRDVLAQLATHPEQIDTLARQAILRARTQFTWAAKAEQVVKVYDWVLGGYVGRCPSSDSIPGSALRQAGQLRGKLGAGPLPT